MLTKTPTRLILRHGRDVSYTRVSEGTYDPATSSYTPSGEVTEVFKAYKTQTSFRDSQQPNLIGKESATYLVSGESISIKPNTGDTITDGDDVFEVMGFSEITALGQSAMYKILVVRS